MFAFSVKVAGFEAAAASLRSLAKDKEVAAMVGQAMASVIRVALDENTGHTDHTLADLAAIDHPYARRHGAIRSDLLGHGGNATDEQRFVHRQSGRLQSSLRAELLPSAASSTGEAWAVWFDVTVAPHAVFVVRGTKRMLPRDLVHFTVTDPRVRQQMMKAVTRVLGPELRAQGSVRFTAR